MPKVSSRVILCIVTSATLGRLLMHYSTVEQTGCLLRVFFRSEALTDNERRQWHKALGLLS